MGWAKDLLQEIHGRDLTLSGRKGTQGLQRPNYIIIATLRLPQVSRGAL